MVFTRKKKTFAKKRIYRKRPYRKQANIAPMVKNIVRKQLMERKVIQSATSAAITNTASISYQLTAIAQGDDINNRNGNVITLTGFSYKGVLSNHTDASNGTMVRIVLVQDLQQVGDTGPGYTDIFEGLTIDSSLNDLTRGRFKVLWSKLITINQSFSGQVLKRYIKKWIKFPNIKVRYNGSANTDIQKNGLYLYFLGDQATNTPTMDDQFKVYYVDN